MRIAVIGWGSLIWDNERTFDISGAWASDGPVLPLEFCRISSKGDPKERITLVIDNKYGKNCQTYWTHMNSLDLNSAVEKLRFREGTSKRNIHSISQDDSPKNEVERIIQTWSLSKEIHSTIWTGLSSNWFEHRGKDFCLEDLEHYLISKKDSFNHIRQYFENAPSQIQTNARELFKKIEKKFP